MNDICEKKYPIFYGATSNDIKEVKKASSGGIFFELAKKMIDESGIVYGAISHEPLEIVHSRATTLSEIDSMRKSKYLRSDLKGIYNKVREDLQSGKKVLFSGVGCQIGGLYKFLGDIDITNLYTVEIVCHGIPLKDSWKKYIDEKETELSAKILDICFRDKRSGWKNNIIAEKYDNGMEILTASDKHPVHQLYLKGINMESGCGRCRFQKLPRIADVTLADFWKADPVVFRDKIETGVSLVAINSRKGETYFEDIRDGLYICQVNIREALSSCRHMSKPPYEAKGRKYFENILKEQSFKKAFCLFKYGDVVPKNELMIFDDLDNELSLIEMFMNDTREVGYYADKTGKLIGLITFGEFLSKYSTGSEYINKHYLSVRYSENCEEEIKTIFLENNKIMRIPIVDDCGRLIFEVRKNAEGENNDQRKILLVAKILKKYGVKSLFVNRPDFLHGYVYSHNQHRRIIEKKTFYEMSCEYDKYKMDFREIIGENVNKEYIECLTQIPGIIKLENRFVHADCEERKINVVGGKRVVRTQCDKHQRSIHIYGRCGVFGYAVSDEETMPSRLQMLIDKDEAAFRVNNCGLWGADDNQIFMNFWADFSEGLIEPGDILIFYMMIPQICMELIGEDAYLSLTSGFHEQLSKKVNFYDKPGHMNAEGYEWVANVIYDSLKKKNYLSCETNPGMSFDLSFKKKKIMDSDIYKYCNNIKQQILDFYFEEKKIGAIVMNCNPFTLGHMYLIEEAKKSVDLLIIFVVEEDKSYFSFNNRMEMVKRAVEGMSNVYVASSGQYMISALTFPEYFTKDCNKNITVNTTYDVNLFAKCIAKELGISVRFVGTEPNDLITRQYNEMLKQILPLNGIELVEIKRKENGNGVISGTKVRQLIIEKNISELRNLVPETTIDILKKEGYL